MKTTGLSVVVVLLFAVGLASGQMNNVGWWKTGVFYQVYPKSFMDSDGNGIGDLKGIISKLTHFKDAGVTGIWLSPINKSPMIDSGYDISDFKDVDPTFGTLQDLEQLIKQAHELGLKVILDLVPNHTSDKHEWFQKSIKSEGDYKDYYIWHDRKGGTDTEPIPPNNWLSVFNNSAWTYNAERKQMYFHQFYKEQPDLNYANAKVQQEMKDIMKFWLDKGLDGFRIDAVPHLFEGDVTKDEPQSNVPGSEPGQHIYLSHTLTKDQPETYKLVKTWRDFVDEYAKTNKRDEILLMTEAYTSLENTLKYYESGAHVPFNFKFITEVNGASSAAQFQAVIQNWIKGKPAEGVANWVMGNHDRSRVATRYPGRADQMTMLAMLLPGVAVTYYGEEIGMSDNTGFPLNDFRDGCRTPFQWNNGTSAGFSTNEKPWLPVHSNYKELNLAKQQEDANSHYKLYKELIKLRASKLLQNGDTHTEVLQNQVLAVVRKNETDVAALLINFNNTSPVTVDVSKIITTSNAKIRLTNVDSGLKANDRLRSSEVKLPAKASVLLVSAAGKASLSMLGFLLLTIFALFRS